MLQGAWLLTEVYDIKLRVIYLTREWKFEWKVVEYNALLCTNSIVFFFLPLAIAILHYLLVRICVTVQVNHSKWFENGEANYLQWRDLGRKAYLCESLCNYICYYQMNLKMRHPISVYPSKILKYSDLRAFFMLNHCLCLLYYLTLFMMLQSVTGHFAPNSFFPIT